MYDDSFRIRSSIHVGTRQISLGTRNPNPYILIIGYITALEALRRTAGTGRRASPCRMCCPLSATRAGARGGATGHCTCHHTTVFRESICRYRPVKHRLGAARSLCMELATNLPPARLCECPVFEDKQKSSKDPTHCTVLGHESHRAGMPLGRWFAMGSRHR